MAMKLRKSQVFVHTSAAAPYLIHCICLHEDLCNMQLYYTSARQHLPFHGSPLSLLIFEISLATTVVDVVRHRVDYISLVIARCPYSFASCTVCRSLALSLWQASKLLPATLSISVFQCSELNGDLYSNTSSAMLQSLASTCLYDNNTVCQARQVAFGY